MKIRDLTCCYAKPRRGSSGDASLVHLAVTIAGGRGSETFCGLRITAVTSATYLGDVCVGCVSRARHMGCT